MTHQLLDKIKNSGRKWPKKVLIVTIFTAAASYRALTWAPLVDIVWMNAAAVTIALHARDWYFSVALLEAVLIVRWLWKFFWVVSGLPPRLATGLATVQNTLRRL